METNIESQGKPEINPAQLQSDMDTIKGVLSESDKSNDIHRIVIAACNLLMAVLFLFAIPILIIVPRIVGLAAEPSPTEPEPAVIVGVVMLIPITVLSILAAPFLLAGWGLLKKKSWGNVFAIIAAILNLLNIPLGTALAIYTFWALSQGKLDTRGG